MRIRQRRAITCVRALFHPTREVREDSVFFQQIHDVERCNVTYDGKWLAKRKNEPSDAYDRDVC
jgi:hypothetical protein